MTERSSFRTWLTFTLLPMFCGCATNLYDRYYQDQLGGRALESMPVVLSQEEPRIIIGGGRIKDDDMRLLEDGFARLGYSDFWADDDMTPAECERKASSVARRKGAALVVLYSKFLGTHTEQISYPVSTASTSSYYATDNQGHSVSVTGRTDTVGTQTRNIDVARYSYVATFWVKKKPPTLGALIRDLSQAERAKLDRNTGVVVTAVIHGSPAFLGGILVDDELFTLDDQMIADMEGEQELVKSHAGQQVSLAGVRGGEPFRLTLTLNQRSIEPPIVAQPSEATHYACVTDNDCPPSLECWPTEHSCKPR